MIDLPGKAIQDFYLKKAKKKLFVHDQFGPRVEMPVSFYFRKFEEMPKLEQIALKNCSGKIMDIGAGAGSHSLFLESENNDVIALEISPAACEVMKSQGLKNVICEDFFKLQNQKFDTLLLLMNGIGISGTLEGFKNFLKKAKNLLNENGKIIFDSCDISYMYDGIQLPEEYFGEVKCRYEYDGEFTEWFKWLYIDQNMMKKITDEEGWNAKVIFEDENDQYLAVISKNI